MKRANVTEAEPSGTKIDHIGDPLAFDFEQFRWSPRKRPAKCNRDTTITARSTLSSQALSHQLLPEILPAPSAFISPTTRWRERFTSITQAEFDGRLPASAEEVPLRLILIGHNPSEHSWNSGTGYSNPSNRFWCTLRQAGILPSSWRPGASLHTLANNMAGDLGIGLTDVLTCPGSDANEFSHAVMLEWRASLYSRLRGHICRAGGAPCLVVFVGKRQWTHLFPRVLPRCHSGLQKTMPPGWPLPSETKVYVVTSPSGRAVISQGTRLAEYATVASALERVAWPLEPCKLSIHE